MQIDKVGFLLVEKSLIIEFKGWILVLYLICSLVNIIFTIIYIILDIFYFIRRLLKAFDDKLDVLSKGRLGTIEGKYRVRISKLCNNT